MERKVLSPPETKSMTHKRRKQIKDAVRKVLHNPNSSKSAKTKAGSVLSQPRRTGKR